MSDSQRSLGCLGLIAVALVVGSITLVVYRVTGQVIRTREMDHNESLTLETHLLQAKAKGQQIFRIFMDGAAQPLSGPWSIVEIGDDIVVLAGETGVLTVRMSALTGVQMEPGAVKTPAPAHAGSAGMTSEPQVEE